jgi:rhodanese-related sulfurtransferase
MSSWGPTTSASWDNNTGDTLLNPEVTNNNAGLTTHDYPVLVGDAASIVNTQAAAMLTAGFKAVSYDDIKDNLGDYFIINYFGEADYLGTGTSGVPGHIPGAFQFTPYASLGAGQMLNNLPTDMPIVVYCWTGQHSSQVTAYLNMLGYEAYSLKFGSNNLFHSSLTAHKWGAGAVMDYSYTVGYEPSEAFAAMAEAGGTYANSVECPGVLSATALNDNLTDYTVVDIRSQADYDAGHIPGAYHSSLATILDDVDGVNIPTDLPIVIACYSGQTAGHAKIALELMGYGDVYSLSFGMCSWNSTLDGSWENNIGDNLPVAETTNNNGDLTTHAYPALAGETAGTVVANRVAAMVAGGLKAKSYDDIKDNLEEYFIVNYFGVADYEGTGTSGVPGHIPGSYQFTPRASLGVGEMLHNLPTDMPIIVYCWTSQTSSQIAAYLNMLGYEAYSLKFGSNHLFHSSLTAHKWTGAADFPLEATPTM